MVRQGLLWQSKELGLGIICNSGIFSIFGIIRIREVFFKFYVFAANLSTLMIMRGKGIGCVRVSLKQR